MPRRKRNPAAAPWEQRKDDDLRIPNATPEEVAQALMQGGAKPRPETKGKRKWPAETVTLTTSVTIPMEVYNVLRFAIETGGIKDPTDEQIVEAALGMTAAHVQTAMEAAAEFHGIKPGD